jgi:uncharacterized protein YdaU (DUF1376 family)
MPTNGRYTGMFWWIDRWRKSSAYSSMNNEQQGAYRNLLDEAWLRGGAIPNDEQVLARASGDARRWSKVRARVMPYFELRQDGWHNLTVDKQLSLHHARAESGRAGAARRWPSDSKPYGKSIANR